MIAEARTEEDNRGSRKDSNLGEGVGFAPRRGRTCGAVILNSWTQIESQRSNKLPLDHQRATDLSSWRGNDDQLL
jgi:hypothetical protein